MNRLKALPIPLRRFVASCLRLPPSGWDRVFEALSLVLPSRFVPALPGQKSIRQLQYCLLMIWGRFMDDLFRNGQIQTQFFREPRQRRLPFGLMTSAWTSTGWSQMYWDSQAILSMISNQGRQSVYEGRSRSAGSAS